MIIQTKNLTKAFGGLVAVNNINFQIEAGKINAIIGPNGAGKSTFFNLVSGFYPPSSGTVIFDGKDITKLPAHKIAKLGIARTFQTTHLFEKASVIENIIIGNRLRTSSGLLDAIFRTKRLKQDDKQAHDKAIEVLKFVGLTDVANQLIGSISQGNQKRAAIALALATEPKILFLDEPAAGINPEETDGLIELIRSIVKKGVTVCLIEHKMHMIMNIADKIMVLNYGKKIAEGSPNEIKKDPVVIEAYLGGN